MDFCNWCKLNEKDFQHELFEGNCVDISTANLVKMDNKMNNLIQHTLIRDRVSKTGIKSIKEIDTNEAYNILWKSLQFLKCLAVLQKIYKKLKNESDFDKKVNFLQTRNKLMRDKPLKVMGLKVSYSDTSISISEEDQLPPFRKALLTDTLPTELKEKKRYKKRSKIKKKEKPQPTPPTEEKIDEEPKDIAQSGRTTSNKKDYKKSKRKKMAELKKLFPDPPKIIKKVVVQEEEEPLDEMYPEPEEYETQIEEAAEEEEIIEKVKPIIKPPKPKKRIIKKIKKKEPPKEEPKQPAFKLRKPLPTDKRRVSESDAPKPTPKRRKRRWTYDDALRYRPNKIDLSPLTMKMPEPPIRLRKPQPGDKRRASDSYNKKKLQAIKRKRRWSYSDGLGSSMGNVELDRNPLKIKLPKPVLSVTSLTSERARSSIQMRKLLLASYKQEELRKLQDVGKLKLPDAFSGR